MPRPSTKKWNESLWYQQTLEDFGVDVSKKRDSPQPWYQFYLNRVPFNPVRGKRFAERVKKTISELLEDGLTPLQTLCLSGDVETISFQIEREKNRFGSTFSLEKQNSLLQFAIVAGSEQAVRLLLEMENGKELLDKGDLVTGFTPFHFATFFENVSVMKLLIQYGADVSKKDKFFATAFDYLRILQLVPPTSFPKSSAIDVWNQEKKSIENWPISKLEQELKITYCPFIIADNSYIEELMFSGFAVYEADLEFRDKYLKKVYSTTGEEDLILSKINDKVGYGVFAKKHFKKGDYIVRYGGKLILEDQVKDKSYNMESGLDAIVLDAKEFRNLGGMLNHSSNPNAESQCVVDRGVEVAIITALRDIESGEQILLNYEKNYWTESELKEMEDLSTIAPLPIQPIQEKNR